MVTIKNYGVDAIVSDFGRQQKSASRKTPAAMAASNAHSSAIAPKARQRARLSTSNVGPASATCVPVGSNATALVLYTASAIGPPLSASRTSTRSARALAITSAELSGDQARIGRPIPAFTFTGSFRLANISRAKGGCADAGMTARKVLAIVAKVIFFSVRRPLPNGPPA